MRFLKLLFYKFYHFAVAIENEGFYPEINAWFLVTLLPWFNFFSLLILLKYYLIITQNTFKVSLILFSSIFWVISFIYFIVGERYKSILQEEEQVKSIKQKQKNFIVIAYSAFSLITYGILSSF